MMSCQRKMFDEEYDIDIRLNDLILKYGLNTYYPEWTQYAQACSLIERLFREISDTEVLAIRGGGQHTVELMKLVERLGMKRKISFIVDIGRKEIAGVKIISPEEAKKQKIDIYLISSFQYALEMEVELRRDISRDVKIINLYDYFRINGLSFNTEYYNLLPYITYPDIYCSKKRYQCAQNMKEQKSYLQILIFQCIEIRDFLSAEQYISEFIQKGFDDRNTYEQAWNDIKNLLNDIERDMKQRTQKDIIINWIDAVEYSNLKEMNYIQEICKRGFVFENAFTPIPWTHTAMASIFKEQMPIEGKTYLFTGKYSSDNSPLLDVLEKGGYGFKYIAYPGIYENEFEDKQRMHYEKSYQKTVCRNRNIGCSTRLQWNSLKERLNNKQPVCHLLHNLVETHEPYMSTWSDDMVLDIWDTDYSERYKVSREYMDQQLRFYARFVGENAVSIYMTDHGKGDGRAYVDDRSRVLMVMDGNIPKRGYENRIYSHLYFNKVIRYIINPMAEYYDDIFKEYALLENIDVYSPQLIEKLQRELLECKGQVMRTRIPCFFQYRAVRTMTDLYVHYAEGPELYYILPDESTNLIEDIRYQDRIETLRKICGSNFIDINTDERFSKSISLHEVVKNIEGIKW